MKIPLLPGQSVFESKRAHAFFFINPVPAAFVAAFLCISFKVSGISVVIWWVAVRRRRTSGTT